MTNITLIPAKGIVCLVSAASNFCYQGWNARAVCGAIRRSGHARARFSQGIAPLMVLWVLALMTLIAATFTRVARTDTNLARNLIENAKAEALADAGVHLAGLKLMQSASAGG